MYSFYGGKPGNPFIIVASFPDINTMTNSFNNKSYTTVHYDEYVIINTTNKNDKDNGKIFRRGYSGPEYIAQIVGPAGPAPHVLFKKPNEVEQHESETGYTTMTSTITSDVMDDSLVPGMDRTKSEDDPEKYHDSITWKCYSVKDANSEESVIQVGFIMPYLVVDFETESISAYNEYGRYSGEPTIEKTDSGQHPFYNKWKIGIPKGIKGDGVSNLRIDTVQVSSNPLVRQTHIYYDITTFSEDPNNTGENQQGNVNGRTETVDLGIYNSITGIDLDNQGTFSIMCTDETQSKTYQREIKWIKNIVKGYYGEDGEGNEIYYNSPGQITFEFNTNLPEDRITLPLDEISNIDVAENGTLTFTMSSENSQYVFQRRIQWIDEVRLTSDGVLQVRYNTNTNTQNPFTDVSGQQHIQWIDNLILDNHGILNAYYNTNPQSPVTLNETAIRWIDSITINNGDLTVVYNDLNNANLQNSVTFNRAMNIPVDIHLNAEEYTLDVDWADPTYKTSLGKYPNSIQRVALDGVGNLLMKFSDPALQGQTSYQGQTNWTYIGNLGNLKSAIISNGTHSIVNETYKGIFQKVTDATDSTTKTHLIFTVNPSKIVPTNTNITLDLSSNNNIIKYSLDESFNLDKTNFNSYVITSDVFGLKFDFTLNNSPTFSGDTAVANILIPSLNLSISIPYEETDEAVIDWQQRLTDLENCSSSSTLVSKANKVYSNNTGIPTLTEPTHAGNDIISALSNIKTQINGSERNLPNYTDFNNAKNIYEALTNLKSAITTLEAAVGGSGEGTGGADKLYYRTTEQENAQSTQGIVALANYLKRTLVKENTLQKPLYWEASKYGGTDIINSLLNHTTKINSLEKKYETTYHKILVTVPAGASTFGILANSDGTTMKARGWNNNVVKSQDAKIAKIQGHYRPLGLVGYNVRGSSNFSIVRVGLFTEATFNDNVPDSDKGYVEGPMTQQLEGHLPFWTEYKNGESKAEIDFFGRVLATNKNSFQFTMTFYILWEKIDD